jgi:hypothetical protein
MLRVTVDPYLSNEQAIKAWGKAGFRPIDEMPVDEEKREPWLLMVAESAREHGSAAP